jgi:hypothetical protein
LNLYSDAVFYPVQRSANPSLGLGKVSHPADITLIEVEGRFKIPVQEGFAFIAALPLSYTLSPETKLDDIGRDDFEHRIALSPSVSISVTQIALPFDITLQYHAPFAGTNALVVHRFSLSGKVYIKL